MSNSILEETTDCEDDEDYTEEDQDFGESILTFVLGQNVSDNQIVDLSDTQDPGYKSDEQVLASEIASLWISFLSTLDIKTCRKIISKCYTVSCDGSNNFIFSNKQVESLSFLFQNDVKLVIDSYNNPKCSHLDINCLFEIKGVACKLGFVSSKMSKSGYTRKIQVKVYSLTEVLGIISIEEKLVRNFEENIRAVIYLFCKTVDLIINGVYSTLNQKLTSKKDYDKQINTIKHMSQLLNSEFYSECSVCFDLTHKQYCIQCKNKLCEICHYKLPFKYVESIDYGVKTCPTCREPLLDDDE